MVAGTGKSHVLVALGVAAVEAGHKVRYYTAAELVETLYLALVTTASAGSSRSARPATPASHGHPSRSQGTQAAAPPGAALRRPQTLAELVFPAEPCAQVRRCAFMTGQVSSRHLAIFSSSRSAARRAGT